MKKILILILVFCCISLFAQISKHDYLIMKDFQRLCRFDPQIRCDMREIEGYYPFFRQFFFPDEEYNKVSPHIGQKTVLLQQTESEWKPIGPEGGNIYGLALNPQKSSEIYALAYSYPSQLYKSTNSGQTWKRIAVMDSRCYDIAVDPLNPNIMYALYNRGIYKSEDKGSNWVEYRFGNYCYGSSPGQISINPNNSNIIYTTGYNVYDASSWKRCMAVYKSTDGGKNWTLKKFAPTSDYGYAHCIAINPLNPNIVYMGGYYRKDDTFYKLYKTSDGGNNWEDKTGSINKYPEAIAIDPTNSSKVYVGTGWNIYRSSDGGQNWQKNDGYAYAYALAIDPIDPNTLYAGYHKSCYKSVDGGVNWTKYSEGIYGFCNRLLAFSASPTQVFYGSNAGIYKSPDGGISWKESHSGMKACLIPALAVVPSSPNIIYIEAANNGFFKSSDFGNTWKRLPDFYRCEDIIKIAINPNNANDLYILAGG